MTRFSKWMVFWLAAVAFLAPLKFGTPVVIQSVTTPPVGCWEWIYFAWPNQLAVIGCVAALVWFVLDPNRRAARVDWLLVLPLVFLATQIAALSGSICPHVSAVTVTYFAVCVLLFYAAAWYVRDGATAARIFGGLALAAFLICVFALQQWLGGLEETRQFASRHLDRAGAPADLLARLTSDRVFGTLVSPDTLAGYLALALAPTLSWIWARSHGWNAKVKWLAISFAGALLVFCLLLTRSRGGFLALGIALVAGLWCALSGNWQPGGPRSRVGDSRRGGPRSRRAASRRRGLGLVLAGAGLALVFFAAYRGGLIGLSGRSLAARLDYWGGAVGIIRDHPWRGTGPGTFGAIYPRYKTALTEEAQLAHNNYLQMWSDSGVAAFVVFALLWLVALRDAWRLAHQRRGDAAALAICAGLAAWTLHGLVDFDLYVPGVAYPAFLLLGALQGLKELPEANETTPVGRGHWLAGLGCALLVGGVVWFQGRELAATFAVGRAARLLPNDPAGAMAALQRAVAWDGADSDYQAAAGDLAVRVGDYRQAVTDYRRAVAANPYRASYHWRLARAELAASASRQAALDQLRLAVQCNPTNARYRAELRELEETVRQGANGLLQLPPAVAR